MENETICRHEIFALINKYIERKKHWHNEMNKHGIDTLDGFGAFCNRERCCDIISDLETLVGIKKY